MEHAWVPYSYNQGWLELLMIVLRFDLCLMNVLHFVLCLMNVLHFNLCLMNVLHFDLCLINVLHFDLCLMNVLHFDLCCRWTAWSPKFQVHDAQGTPHFEINGECCFCMPCTDIHFTVSSCCNRFHSAQMSTSSGLQVFHVSINSKEDLSIMGNVTIYNW